MKKLKKALWILLGLVVLIQLVPFGRSHTNPPVVKEVAWDSAQTKALVRRACYDCHSNETVWPWYSNVAPVSWLVQRDVTSLGDHATYLTGKNQFMLDATLGLINLEQNQIIKIFSIAAVCLMPPTLVASVYGMNFKHMPELDWEFGYPMSLILMIIAALLPYLYFKRRGWL